MNTINTVQYKETFESEIAEFMLEQFEYSKFDEILTIQTHLQSIRLQ